MVAGTVTEDDGSQSVIAAGGANFPQAAPGASTPEERGPKTYYQDIFKLRNGQWSKAGTLPVPLVTPPLPAWARGWLWPEATMLRAS